MLSNNLRSTKSGATALNFEWTLNVQLVSDQYGFNVGFPTTTGSFTNTSGGWDNGTYFVNAFRWDDIDNTLEFIFDGNNEGWDLSNIKDLTVAGTNYGPPDSFSAFSLPWYSWNVPTQPSWATIGSNRNVQIKIVFP